jgi:hypothetical protein
LLRALYDHAPRSIWRGCAWFKAMRDPAATFAKLVETFSQLPDNAGLPPAGSFRQAGNAAAALRFLWC